MIENLTQLCSTVGRKALQSVGLGYLGEDISKQSVEGVRCFLLAAYSKMQKEIS